MLRPTLRCLSRSAPCGKLGRLKDRNVRRLPSGPPSPEQLLGADERHVKELSRQVLEAWVARTCSEQVGREKSAERPLALSTPKRSQCELGLFGVMARDGPAGERY